MTKIQNKSTKKIRVVLIVIFIIQIFLTATPFMWSEGLFVSMNSDTQSSSSELSSSWICSNCGATNDGSTCESCGSARKSTFTALDLIMYMGASTGDEDSDRVLNIIGACFLSFLILPLVALLFQIFDRNYNIKNVVGLLCSGLSVICILYFVEGYLCIGSLLALLMYLLSFFFCVMGIFARYLKTENTAEVK